eukprot:2741488-Amphidinium_carterae.1
MDALFPWVSCPSAFLNQARTPRTRLHNLQRSLCNNFASSPTNRKQLKKREQIKMNGHPMHTRGNRVAEHEGPWRGHRGRA